jgi:hypothetical protein
MSRALIRREGKKYEKIISYEKNYVYARTKDKTKENRRKKREKRYD